MARELSTHGIDLLDFPERTQPYAIPHLVLQHYLLNSGFDPLHGQLRLLVVGIGGILATVCPADKKILHGMKDAIMLPCVAHDPA